MESELFCNFCEELFCKPLNLPCGHNICQACAYKCVNETKQQPTQALNEISAKSMSLPNRRRKISENTNLCPGNLANDRTDCSSDDSGYLSMHEIHACLHQQFHGPMVSIKCPSCAVSFVLDDRGIDCLPLNIILESLVELYKCKNSEIDCQLCEAVPPNKATSMCEQCRVSYCEGCLKIYHPKRGPLASHTLSAPSNNQCVLKHRGGVLKCSEHAEENISMYCVLCKMPVCYLCFEEGRHCGHEARALGTMYKEQKVEMTSRGDRLKDKKKNLNDFIQTLDVHVSKVQENGVDFESRVVAQIDELIGALEEKKTQLIASIGGRVAGKLDILNKQREECSSNHRMMTGLLAYVDEVTKEEDPAVFLLISSALSSRLLHTLDTWIGRHGLLPEENSEMELGLETSDVLTALNRCDFVKVVTPIRIDKPTTPIIDDTKCEVINNTLTLEWSMNSSTQIDEFVIEVDDGLNGDFQEVHRTPDPYCTLGGLQFNSTYRSRVRAVNSAGESTPSDVICMSTPEIAVFSLDSTTSHADINLSNNNRTMNTGSFENRVAIADVGFSRGQHYWEVTIDRYEGNPDPAIGIAQLDCSKDVILGRDSKAWSVYVDSTRSWFQHNNAHLYRSEGGIEVGSTIGLYLDLDQCLLSFYCNDEKHGPIEFPSLEDVDVVYPAFSLNRNVTMTLYSGIKPPAEV
ncbi:E3 ubiquitin-protein ligase TRIM9-like [Clytia hemisphaerica]|uniref:E3 ubiquitin-protein ligase TRIM9-like n=1 Tax=Clytia hemisphaerica TaxID=252671 RepID=UPI0034D753B4|eukprot:TCONS_00054179-protein